MDKKVMIGVGVATAAIMAGGLATATYLLMKDDEEDQGHVSSRPVTLHVKIRTEFAGLVIGRGGENIREIQRRTNTRIHFKDELETTTHRVLSVSGRGDEAQLAEILIHQTIANQPKLETLVLTVPGHCVGYIIGHGGDTIRSIQNMSKCRIDVERSSGSGPRRITLKGTSEQISLAKDMIDDKVMFANDKPAAAAPDRDIPDRQNKTSVLYLTSENETDSESAVENLKDHYQKIWLEESSDPSNSNFVEVYVSSVTDPWEFNVQKVGPESIQLDRLSQDMSRFYDIEPNRVLNSLESITIDDIVAAQFSMDKNWYRSKILIVTSDEYDENLTKVHVEFVDFGICEVKAKTELFQLKPEFLKLKFQAINCSLANVKPTGDVWSEESIEEFEKLSYAFQWKVILAKLSGFKVSEGSNPIPIIELVDAKGESDVIVGDQLIAKGLAQSMKQSD